MTVFEHPEFNKHRQVHFFEDKRVGLKVIIAIHHLVSGISGGGCRFYPYAQTCDALTDVLRLSRAMTYKFALAGVAFGGGKAVIIGDPEKIKSEKLLEAFGRMVDSLNGQYVTAGDVGTNEEDMLIIKRSTPHVVGAKGEAGDTSRITGYGVFQSILAAVGFMFPERALKDIRVAVQGAGGVGRHLVGHLLNAEIQVRIADINPRALEKVKQLGKVKVVAPDKILFEEADVLAPCALGGIINEQTIPGIKARIIAGGANNQLASESDAYTLHQEGIFFIPDFIANAGGVIQGSGHMAGKNDARIIEDAKVIYENTQKVLEASRQQNRLPLEIAYQMAEAFLT